MVGATQAGIEVALSGRAEDTECQIGHGEWFCAQFTTLILRKGGYGGYCGRIRGVFGGNNSIIISSWRYQLVLLYGRLSFTFIGKRGGDIFLGCIDDGNHRVGFTFGRR